MVTEKQCSVGILADLPNFLALTSCSVTLCVVGMLIPGHGPEWVESVLRGSDAGHEGIPNTQASSAKFTVNLEQQNC